MTEEVLLWPNPAGDNFTVGGANGNDIIMYDVTGRQVYRASISSNKQEINIGFLQSGIYVVHVVAQSTGQRVVKKIIKE